MFIESIQFKNKEAPLLEYHRRRIIDTLNHEKNKEGISKEDEQKIEIAKSILVFLLSSLKPPQETKMVKCRVTYDPYDITKRKVEFEPYFPDSIASLQLVDGKDIVYDYKYSDRRKIDEIFNQRGKADDVLIIRKGMITDASCCNIVFFDGNRWVTPQEPLLPGVMRSYLLNLKVIEKVPIRIPDLVKFRYFKLINAMRDFHTAEEIPMDKIMFKNKPIL